MVSTKLKRDDTIVDRISRRWKYLSQMILILVAGIGIRAIFCRGGGGGGKPFAQKMFAS